MTNTVNMDNKQQWTVHAEFTINHPGMRNPSNPPLLNTVQDEKGIRMLYYWTAKDHQIVASDSEGSFGVKKGQSHLSVPTQDSAYGSDLSTCSQNNSQRKCNITASCGRTQSLRCQTPSMCYERKPGAENYYGCGDPWCHHVQYDDFRRISPLREACEDIASESCTIYHRNVKDASVQTYEMVNKCTSPMLKTTGTKLKRSRVVAYNRSRQSSLRSSTSPVSVKIDDSQTQEAPHSSSFKHSASKASTKTGSGSEDSSKKPRTIHIDVYCTGTEIETDSSSSDSDSRSKSASTPQTVFESKKMCVTHKKADDKILPYHLAKMKSTSTEIVKEDSDNEDGFSTGYPSKVSSYTTIGRSISSMQSSVTPFSISSCTVPDYESSACNTSWKDTFSDIDSLLHSRSSIPQNDSLYFVPRRIEEEVAGNNTSNSANLAPSDSFDYADSEDKLRIKRMERMWKHKLLQDRTLEEQDKLQEAVDKRLSMMNVSKDSDTEGSEGSEKGWTVLNRNNLTKSMSTPKVISPKPVMIADVKTSHVLTAQLRDDASSPVCRSPSTVLIKERLKENPALRSPFTIVPGRYSQPRYIAKRFGPVITVFKKPGHHVGPAKNPSCACDHCRSHFDNAGYRNRTCSLGDTPLSPPLFANWAGLKKTKE